MLEIKDWCCNISSPIHFWIFSMISLKYSVLLLWASQVAQWEKNGSVVKNLPANAGNVSSISGSRRSPGEGNGNPLQHSCLGNPMGRGAWEATVHGFTKQSDIMTKNLLYYNSQSYFRTKIAFCCFKTEGGLQNKYSIYVSYFVEDLRFSLLSY